MDAEIESLARRALEALRAKGLTLATVESCTGGLVAASLTAIAGSSDVLERGWVTYSNEAKSALVGVPMTLIAEHGAVSAPVAEAMARGGIVASAATLAIAVTGVAGPGSSERKPAGLVYLAVARRRRSDVTVEERRFAGDRAAVRRAAVERVLQLVLAEA